jgi:hypothetical protein
MLVTQVEMLLHHADRTQTTKMEAWLKDDPKFLFRINTHIAYGFQNYNATWDDAEIRLDSWIRTGSSIDYIDLRFTLRSYVYPLTLARIL